MIWVWALDSPVGRKAGNHRIHGTHGRGGSFGIETLSRGGNLVWTRAYGREACYVAIEGKNARRGKD